MPVATALTTHDIEALFRLPRQGEEMLISAHRGLRWDGVPENVRSVGRRRGFNTCRAKRRF